MGLMDNFKQLGDMKAMRDQAVKIQQMLAKETIEITKGNLKITITGDQRVQYVEINGVENRDVRDAFNEAIRKSQELAARKMFEMNG